MEDQEMPQPQPDPFAPVKDKRAFLPLALAAGCAAILTVWLLKGNLRPVEPEDKFPLLTVDQTLPFRVIDVNPTTGEKKDEILELYLETGGYLKIRRVRSVTQP